MYHLRSRRSAPAALATAIALTGSVLLGPAIPAGAEGSAAVADTDRGAERSVARARPFRVAGEGAGVGRVRDDGVITFVVAGTQRGTNLGRSTWRTEGECTTPTCSSLVGRTTNIAANGDRLYFLETNDEGRLSVVITGGTGRFAGATGALTPVVSIVTPDPTNPLAFSTTFDYRGTITLVRGRR